ncbi:hypothetical protein V6N13_047637 [Hibiscus sabdariffa]
MNKCGGIVCNAAGLPARSTWKQGSPWNMVLDLAIPAHAGARVSSDTLAHLWAAARTLRIAVGGNEVHLLVRELERDKL